jgi:hypothetical protein
LLALNNVARQLYGLDYDFQALLQARPPETAFSLKALAALSRQFRFDLVPVERLEGEEIVVPSVVHWRQNHFAAILSERGGWYKVADPTFGYPQYLTAAAINSEASGKFLVSARQAPRNWRILTDEEAGLVLGRGVIYLIDDRNDQTRTNACPADCPSAFGGAGGGSPGGGCFWCEGLLGLPVWRISEPFIFNNSRLRVYLDSSGLATNFTLTYPDGRQYAYDFLLEPAAVRRIACQFG